MSENPFRWTRRSMCRGPAVPRSAWPDAVAQLLAELTTVDPVQAAAPREVLDAMCAPAAAGEVLDRPRRWPRCGPLGFNQSSRTGESRT